MADYKYCGCLDGALPEGVNIPGGSGIGTSPAQPAKPIIWQVLSGNSNTLTARVNLIDVVTPATPANSILAFNLAENQFQPTPLWIGTWQSGITEVTPGSGVVKVNLPSAIVDCLRRGSYMFNLRVTDKLGNDAHIPVSGSILVEYTVGGPQHDIPYRHDTWPY